MSSVPGTKILARIRARDDLPDLRQAAEAPAYRPPAGDVRPGLLERAAQASARCRAALRRAFQYEELDGVRAEAARIAARDP